MRKTVLLIAAVMIIVGAFFFVSSVTLVNCAGTLIVNGGCEEWLRDVVPTFWFVGAAFFSAAVAILLLGPESSVRQRHFKARRLSLKRLKAYGISESRSLPVFPFSFL